MSKPPLSKAKGPVILAPSSRLITAERVFERGGIIAYPTETFYGLGVDPFNEGAVKSLFALKGRPAGKPISLLIKDIDMLSVVARSVTAPAKALMKKFWPGPLTIIFKAAPGVPRSITAGTGTVGARVSSCPVAQKLIGRLNSPVTATSANPSAKPSPCAPEDVLKYFDGSVDVLIDSGRLPGGLGSTVVDATGNEIKILRLGRITPEEIFKALK